MTTKRPLNKKLSEVVESYINSIQRGMGTSPYLSCRSENRESVLRHSEKYEKEYKEKIFTKFEVEIRLSIKNEEKEQKWTKNTTKNEK